MFSIIYLLRSIIFFVLYSFVSFFIYFTSSLWTIYFGFELTWMLLTVLIIIGSSVWRGLLNYLMLNGILSIWLIAGILLSNCLFFIYGIIGKVGYFPFFLIISYQYYSSSYIFILFDLLNKFTYFNAFIIIIHLSTSNLLYFVNLFVLMNFFITISIIKFVLSIKHLILISSLQLFLFILCGLYFVSELFSFSFLLSYTITTIYILLDLLSFRFRRSKSLNRIYIMPLFLTDLLNLKQLIVISALLFIIYWLIIFSNSNFIWFII